MINYHSLLLKCFQVIELMGRKIDDHLFKLPKTELLCAGMIVVAKKNKAEYRTAMKIIHTYLSNSSFIK